MIALNWQHSGKGMMLNHAMFAGTGGWVLKPKGYRYSGDFPASSALQSANGEYDVYGTFDFAIDVLAGQHIPVSGLGKDFSATNFRPYVKCQLHICTSDLQRLDNDDSTQGKEGKKSKFKKRTKSSTGDDPDFGGEKLVFPQVSNVIPELSFIRYVHSCSFTKIMRSGRTYVILHSIAYDFMFTCFRYCCHFPCPTTLGGSGDP